MQTRIRSFHTVLWVFLAAAQILFLCAVSWRAGGAVLDYDAAKAFTHMIAIWESGTLIVPEWQYITTMELDCAVLLALPFYGLTRDVLLPYELYLTGYWNMMFLNASQYAFKVMLPLLCAALLLGPDRPRRSDWALLFIYLAGCALTALSSGVYVAACGLAPVYGVGIYEWLQGRLRGTPYRLACLIGGAAVTLAGVAVQAYLGISTNASSMTLNSLSTIRDNTVNCLIGFFRLFGAMPADNPAVFSVSGIAALLRMALVCGLLGLAFWFLLRVLSGTLPSALRPARYLAAQCTEVGRTAEHLILRTAGAPLVDGLVGLPYGTEGIDYPDSNWYSQRGEMDEKRRLHADPAGGEVLRSAALNIHTDVRVTLFSQSGKESGTIGTFRLLEDESGKVIAECPMPAGEAEATLRIPAGRDLAISLEVEPNCGAVVGPIYFEAETDEAGLRR